METLEGMLQKAMGNDPGAVQTMLRRVNAVRASMKAGATGLAKPYNYEFRDRAPAAPQASAVVKTLKDGTTWRQLGPGKWERVQ